MPLSGLTLDDFLTRFQLYPPPEMLSSTSGLRHAAILVPIVRRPRPGLLLTQRASLLRHHPGEVAFPGGKAEENDGNLITTALRETEEETGIKPQAITVIGQLSPVESISGFRVTPVVGLIDPSTPFHVSESEVAAVFEVPLSYALAMVSRSPLTIRRHHQPHHLWFLWYQRYFIWGMTAGIIRNIAEQLHLPMDNKNHC